MITQESILWFLHETPSSVISAILQEWDIIFTVSLSIISTCRQAAHEPTQDGNNLTIMFLAVFKLEQVSRKRNECVCVD